MNDRAQRIWADALALPPDDRAALATALLSSLDETAGEEAWRHDVLRRANDDSANDTDWETARDQVRRRLST